jgi:hypothetical protein
VAPGEELVDGDAVPYYLAGPDGKFREFYGHFAPLDRVVYLEAHAPAADEQ